jgi:hypothetical protein
MEISNFKKLKIRSKKHLAFVRSQQCCLVWEGGQCNGTPVDPHHLMKIGGRGISLKESDEWTVPLCRKHHTDVTGYGDKEVFWNRYDFSYEYVKEIAINLARLSPDEEIRNTVNLTIGE